jgi:uncharacterized membrane protein
MEPIWCAKMNKSQLTNIILCILLAISFNASGYTDTFTPAQSTTMFLDPVTIRALTFTNGSTRLSIDASVRTADSGAESPLSFRIESLDVALLYATINGSVADSTLRSLDRYTLVEVPFESGLDVNESLRLRIELVCGDIVSQTIPPVPGNLLQGSFIYYVRPSLVFYNFTFLLVLPPHASLSQESVAPLFPDSQFNYTDGHSVAFVWNTDELQPGQENVYIVKYEIPISVVTDTSFPLLPVIGLILSSFAAGVLVIKYGPSVLSRLRNIGSVRVVGITDDEEEMLEIIRAKGGSCPQKDLYTESGMSQAKVSLVLSNLEERGMVKRFREGRENVVHIIEG